MFNFLKKMSNGARCAAIATIVFIVVVFAGFPGVIPVVGKVVLLSSAFAVFFAIIAGLMYLADRFDDKLGWFPVVVGSGLAAAIMMLLLYFSSFVARTGYKALNGLPVDQFGTIIPLNGWLASAFIGVALLATICMSKHLIVPTVKLDNRVHEKLLVVALTLGFGLVFFAFPGGIVYLSYHTQNPAVERQKISSQIEKLQKQIDERRKAIEAIAD